MTQAMVIRNAGPGDVECIAAIHVSSWQSAYRGLLPDSYLDSLTAEQRLPMWKQILGSPIPSVSVWVATIEDEIVGFCSIGPPESSGADATDPLVLHTIYLQPGHERRGIGGALLRHAEQGMQHLGAGSAILWVLSGNGRATRFYEASGWKPDGVEKLDQIFGQTVREVRYSKRLAVNTSS